ncbi:MAG: hypothetical protein JWP74_3480 [Marmoricola sp.]|nr:hypothetical protein [Marmoricola sp.]
MSLLEHVFEPRCRALLGLEVLTWSASREQIGNLNAKCSGDLRDDHQ